MPITSASVITRLAAATAATAATAAGGLIGLAAYATEQLNGRMPRRFLDSYTFTPFEVGADSEEITITSTDGLKLAGWWLPRPDSRRVVICCAGHHGDKSEMLGIGSGLWRNGNNVLLFDWRNRGESEGSYYTLAHDELHDLEGALAYATQRMPDGRIGLVGYSMGAAVVLITAARQSAVQAVVADSPFTSIADLVRYASARRGLPAWAVIPIANLLNSARYGYRFDDVRPIDHVAAISPRPLLLIHGAGDTVIPADHSRRLFEAAREPKQLWLADDLEHCGAYFHDRQAYIERVAAFFQQYLGYA